MLKNTFCHIPQIGSSTEYHLWSEGIHSWEHVDDLHRSGLGPSKIYSIQKYIERSHRHLLKNNIGFFYDTLPSREHWRLFPEFKHSVAYLDIETTGLYYSDHITTIALYDGKEVYHYVYGKNLRKFKKDIKRYNLIVTYNGKCFDIPFIERYFDITIDAAHIDLRYVLNSLGYKGGLKGCEKKLKLSRKDMSEIDGYFAVLLWKEYRKRKNTRALDTLLAYNIQDVINLEQLMTISYNKKIIGTPFKKNLQLPDVPLFQNPFKPYKTVINIIKREYPWIYYG